MSPKKTPAEKPPKREKTVNVQDLGNVHKALFEFQRAGLTLPRNGKGFVNQKAYSYVTLDDLITGIRPLLEKNGLVFTQAVTGDKLITTLVHAPSGTSIVGDIHLGNPSNMQDYGSRITYARRYALTALLGINAETDVDATGSTVAPVPASPATPGGSISTPPAQTVSTPPQATASAPVAPEPVPMNATMSEPFKRAKTAVETCYSIEALNLIRGQVEKSEKLTAEEKTQLLVLVDSRQAVIQFDKQ